MAVKRAPENPYLAARQEWSERYGSYVRAAAAWRLVGVLALGLALTGFIYALYQSSQVKHVPYIVEVDKLGNTVFGGFPQQIAYADPRVVRATLSGFISAFRGITPDAIVQKQSIDRTYALLRGSDPSTQKVNDWFRSHSPFERAKNATVSVEVTSIVAISNQTYQIDWMEYERDRKGRETGARRFRGIATVTITEPQDEATIRLNPIGLYIRDLDWTAQL
jgi:type IV secretion system protein VirB5